MSEYFGKNTLMSVPRPHESFPFRPLMDRGKKKLEDNSLDPAGRLRSRTKTKGRNGLAWSAGLGMW